MLKLKEIRKQKQFTQVQIANILSIHKSQIGRIEKGNATINNEQIIKLCNALNCRADHLLGLVDFDDETYKK